MKLKILSVDFNFDNKNVDINSFEGKLSFSDYDIAVIDPINIPKKWFNRIPVVTEGDGTHWAYSIEDGGLSNFLSELMKTRAEEVKLLTERNQGIVVCFFRNAGERLNCAERNLPSYKDKAFAINRYSWVPTLNDKHGRSSKIYYYIKNRDGKEIGKIYEEHPFSEYIKNFKDEIRYEAVLDESIFILKPIAMNKANELIAFEIAFGNGKFIFLPPVLQATDSKRVAGVLLDCIKNSMNSPQLDLSPSWIKNYNLPGEEQLLKKLEEVDLKEKELVTGKNEITQEINRLKFIKSLLYGSGKYVLESAVREAFKIIGFNVLDPDSYKEEFDLLVKKGDLIIIGEVEGSSGQIAKQKYQQLLDYVDSITQEGKKCKGLLIGNGFLSEEPSTRGEQFTEAVINGCRRQGFCRVTTFELFKAVEKVLASPNDSEIKERIKKAILSCNEEFILSSLDIK